MEIPAILQKCYREIKTLLRELYEARSLVFFISSGMLFRDFFLNGEDCGRRHMSFIDP